MATDISDVTLYTPVDLVFLPAGNEGELMRPLRIKSKHLDAKKLRRRFKHDILSLSVTEGFGVQTIHHIL